MITKEKIDEYIEKIPPTPKTLKDTVALLNAGELTKAAKIAQSDPALQAYLKKMLSKPIYGFRNEINDVAQMFGILGVSGSQQSVYNYMLTLLSPAKWHFYKLSLSSFHELQARLSANWKKILVHLNIQNKDIESAITLLPASIIVSEALFFEKKNDVELLRNTKDIDLNTILQRLCGVDLFDICEQIAVKWEMPPNIAKIVQASSGKKPINNKELALLAKWMHLLLFYELSQPMFIEAGLNDFLEFQVDFVADIYDDFSSLMEIA